MQFFVENGLAGADLALRSEAIAVVVDALRASANIASMFHYGTRELVVVREVQEAFDQKAHWPDAVLVGERGGPVVPGFDLGNSPLQAPPEIPLDRVIFSSSNCSRCCVGVADAPAAFIASTVNATAAARAILNAGRKSAIDRAVLVTAGAVEDEVLLTIEDHLAAGAVMAACEALGADVEAGNDRARVCSLLFADGDREILTARFLESQNGRRLSALGLGADVEFASRLDVFDIAPRIGGIVALDGGGKGAVLTCP